jgi:hypothetical protein
MQASFHVPQEVMKHDIAFHEAIGVASRNPMFALIVGSFHVVTRQTWPIGWASRASDDSRQESIDCHLAIARAIAERDPGDRRGGDGRPFRSDRQGPADGRCVLGGVDEDHPARNDPHRRLPQSPVGRDRDR